MAWIKQSVFLKGNQVNLVPLETSHYDELINLSKDPRIWKHYAIDGSDSTKLKSSLENALVERLKGNQYPFVIAHKKENKIIGSTRFLDINQEHKKLEIGWTWLSPEYWGKTVNLESKLLLLTYCFENLSARRVQLKTDENNIRSRKAIEKIGGQFEGIIRNDMIRYNGTSRQSAYYSIIDNEWLDIKIRLNKLIEKS